MNYNLVELFSYSIAIAAMISLVRFRRTDRAYLPFFLLMWTGLLNELINTIIISRGFSNAVNTNIYTLIEVALILWFFYNFRIFRHRNLSFGILLLLILSTWIAENFVFSSIRSFSSYFIVFSYFMIVLLSITMINKVQAAERKGLLKNSKFIICTGFILFFTYALLVEIFWIYGLNASKSFRLEVYRIMAYVNLVVNIIYAIAVLWMPRKQESLLLS
ncbi:MAG: hypothetical protein JNJ86_16935 [Chitinophagaceae bacterium]|nr:hypothetical protein [Chitinophagaceae bacterium]